MHRKLAPLRQKGREFFNLGTDDALIVLQSIIDSQSSIKILDMPVTRPEETKVNVQRKRRKPVAASDRHHEYAEYLKIFTSVLTIKGRPFGQLNMPWFGMSDDNFGTQWNLALTAESNEAHLGVNLEGLKYDDWPIAKLLLSEQNHPSLENLKSQVNDPDGIFIRLVRDAWQGPSRPEIKEQFIGGGMVSLAETDNRKWLQMVREALDCLDSTKSYRGRTKQLVTRVKQPMKGDRRRLMDVSPHLTVLCKVGLGEGFEDDFKRKLREMEPVYNWMKGLAGR